MKELCLTKLLAVFALSMLSVIGYLGSLDTFQTGEDFFFMDEKTKMGAYIALYSILIGAQFSAGFIVSLFTKGWVRDASTIIVSGLIVISGMNAHTSASSDPFRYLEPVKLEKIEYLTLARSGNIIKVSAKNRA